jgi:UDP-N-acetylglucosamine acyltransferase
MTQALVDPDFTLGENVVVGHGSVLSGPGKIAANVVIGHHVIIEGDVDIGEGTRIGHHAVLKGPLRIGSRNEIYPFVSLGLRAQHPDYHGNGGPVIIGQENVLREFVTVHAATYDEFTILGNGNYIMAYSHIAHDCRVGSYNKFANNATLAGHVCIGDHCYLGLHSIFHQRISVGDLCMIGMNETVTRHVPPFAVLADGRFLKINTRGLSLNGRTQTEIREIENRYRRGTSNDPANANQLIIDAFLAAQTKGGVYRYEKAQPSPSSIGTLTPPQ